MEEKENVYVLETDRKIPDQSDLQIIEQTGNTYKLEVNSVMEVLSNLEKQGVQVKNITQIHKTLEDVYNEFIQSIIMMYELKSLSLINEMSVYLDFLYSFLFVL